MSTVVERLQQTITALRSRLANERKVYMDWSGKFSQHGASYWPNVSAAIKIIAFYYHGEIVRCKHDTADYMLGHEVHGTYGDAKAVEELHDAISELHINAASLDEEKEKGNTVVITELEDYIKDSAKFVDDLATALEEVTYAEK